MGYLETLGVKPYMPKEEGTYMEGVETNETFDCPCNGNYFGTIDAEGIELEPVREKGYLGWFLNLKECLEAYPNPRKGMTYNNVETRSVWIYDGAHWRNTTQGNPFHLIYDIENAGAVKRGYAQSFYYVPTQHDVDGGTITFHFLVNGKDMWVECDVHYTSDIVLIEWNGSDFVSRVRSLDERTAYVEGDNIVDGQGRVVVDSNAIESAIDDCGEKIEAEKNRAEGAEEELAENLSILQGNTQSAVSVLSRAINAEQLRAEEAEAGIETELDSLEQEYGKFVGTVQQGLGVLARAVADKQDEIPDLDTIRSGASKGATALQEVPSEYVTELQGKQDEIPDLDDIRSGAEKGAGLVRNDGALVLEKGVIVDNDYGAVYALPNDDRSNSEEVDFNLVAEEFLKTINGQSLVRMPGEDGNIEITGGGGADMSEYVDEDGCLLSKGERVDMRFTRSLLPVGTEVVASANLNTIEYLKVGKYFCRQNATAKTVKNCPVNVAFAMEVFNPLSPTYDDETTAEYTYRVRVLTQYDTGQQYLQFCKTSGTPGKWTYESWYVTPRTLFTLASSKNDGTAALGSGTQGIYVDSTGTLKKMTYTLAKSVPSSAVFTDTKVTAVGNHYSPEENAKAAIEATEGEYVTGVKRDAAGHVVGVVSSVMQIDGKSVPDYVTEECGKRIENITNVYPSGDPMHMAYVAAGAVWDEATQTWSANGRSGLNNSEIRSLYNKSDMDELLFRKLWNSCNALTYENNKVKYDENTGFYRANGVWHIEYDEALEIFARNPYIAIGGRMRSTAGFDYAAITNLPMVSSQFVPNNEFSVYCSRRLVDLRRNVFEVSNNGFPNNTMTASSSDKVILGYCYNLRIVRDLVLWGSTTITNFIIDERCNSLTHLLICNIVNNVGRVFNFSKVPRLSYLSVYYFLSNSKYGCTLQLHPNVYSFIMGTANPEDLGKAPLLPEHATYYYIPYQQNLKILPDNAFWREELDVKGANGEYIYPSFVEYLANNPQNFATGEEWQALASLAEEKGITITV